ncbi:MAG: nucleotide exchange factor GrpE [Pseudomonadales bacterium]|nr:nucleotide exchange factor GrpE [Pseudomonadales bacterium]
MTNAAGKNTTKATPQPRLEEKVAELEAALSAASEREKRAVSDYQNLVRRTADERLRLIRMSNKDFVESLLQPLEHLSLAAEQIDDQGLRMVIDQLWQTLEQQGLEEMKVLNQPFDVATMEVVEKEGDGDVVSKVVSRGYTLNGEVIQFAKVVLS